ncbi:hypothetical protein EV121DRAFT_296853 [Schizophyllum commune]
MPPAESLEQRTSSPLPTWPPPASSWHPDMSGPPMSGPPPTWPPPPHLQPPPSNFQPIPTMLPPPAMPPPSPATQVPPSATQMQPSTMTMMPPPPPPTWPPSINLQAAATQLPPPATQLPPPATQLPPPASQTPPSAPPPTPVVSIPSPRGPRETDAPTIPPSSNAPAQPSTIFKAYTPRAQSSHRSPSPRQFVHTTGGRKRKRRGIPKKDRKNRKNWAEGVRAEILSQYIARYTDVVAEGGWSKGQEVIREVCAEYHAKIPWQLPDHDEPDLPLPEYNPKNPPVQLHLSDEEEAARSAALTEKNAAIHRWIHWRARKIPGYRQQYRANRNNPYDRVVLELAGMSPKGSKKALQPVQQYAKEHPEAVEEAGDVFEEEKAAGGGLVKHGDSFIEKKSVNWVMSYIKKQYFDKLSRQEKAAYGERARKVAADEKAAWEEALKEPPKRDAKSLELAWQCLQNYVEPLLRGIVTHLDAKVVLIVGARAPHKGGAPLSRHFTMGKNLNGVPFKEWDTDMFQNKILASFVEFLDTCWTQEQCDAVAEGAEPAANTDGDPKSLGRTDFTAEEISDESDEDESDAEDDEPLAKRAAKASKTTGVRKNRRAAPPPHVAAPSLDATPTVTHEQSTAPPHPLVDLGSAASSARASPQALSSAPQEHAIEDEHAAPARLADEQLSGDLPSLEHPQAMPPKRKQPTDTPSEREQPAPKRQQQATTPSECEQPALLVLEQPMPSSEPEHPTPSTSTTRSRRPRPRPPPRRSPERSPPPMIIDPQLASAATAITGLELPASADGKADALWFREAWKYVALNFGHQWISLLHEFAAWENINGYNNAKGVKGLPVLNTRPKEVSTWIAHARWTRGLSGEPSPKTPEFAQRVLRQWWEWYARLSPGWRKRRDDGTLEPVLTVTNKELNDLGKLECHGLNGVFNLVVVLKWVKEAMLSSEVEVTKLEVQWIDSVCDLGSMLSLMVEKKRRAS